MSSTTMPWNADAPAPPFIVASALQAAAGSATCVSQ